MAPMAIPAFSEAFMSFLAFGAASVVSLDGGDAVRVGWDVEVADGICEESQLLVPLAIGISTSREMLTVDCANRFPSSSAVVVMSSPLESMWSGNTGALTCWSA